MKCSIYYPGTTKPQYEYSRPCFYDLVIKQYYKSGVLKSEEFWGNNYSMGINYREFDRRGKCIKFKREDRSSKYDYKRKQRYERGMLKFK